MKPIALIVACSENRVIGRAGRLPFDIPEDKAWFHDWTAGAVCILGRICFETWPRAMADGRRPVVISSDPGRIRNAALRKAAQAKEPAAAGPPDVPVVRNVAEALALAQSLPGNILVCGGQRIYEESLPIADRLILTLVHASIEGDTTFPDWRALPWTETWRRESRDANYRYTFSILDRRKPAEPPA